MNFFSADHQDRADADLCPDPDPQHCLNASTIDQNRTIKLSGTVSVVVLVDL
jgi:hypothetical protein